MKRTEEALAAALHEIRESRAKFRQAARTISPPQQPANMPAQEPEAEDLEEAV